MSEINFDESPAITQDDLKNITMLATHVRIYEDEVSAVEEMLKKAKAKLRKVQDFELPEAMLACNMEKFTTADGLTVSVKETLTASIAAKNKPAAAKWLLENQLGSLVKEDVIIGFDNGASDKVQDLINLLADNGITNISTAESMNTASIKAAIKELLAEGKEVPLELFGAHFYRKAVVK